MNCKTIYELYMLYIELYMLYMRELRKATNDPTILWETLQKNDASEILIACLFIVAGSTIIMIKILKNGAFINLGKKTQ